MKKSNKRKQHEAMWTEHIHKSMQGKQSKNAYCKEHGLSDKSFYYWQKKILKKNPSLKNEFKEKSNFLPVQIQKSAETEAIKLCLPCEITIESNTYPDSKWISEIILLLCSRNKCSV